MTWVRSKPPEQVRASALAMITAKTRQGCAFRVDAYVDLARRFGATDAEITSALAATPPEPDHGIRETSRYADSQQQSTPLANTRNA